MAVEVNGLIDFEEIRNALVRLHGVFQGRLAVLSKGHLGQHQRAFHCTVEVELNDGLVAQRAELFDRSGEVEVVPVHGHSFRCQLHFSTGVHYMYDTVACNATATIQALQTMIAMTTNFHNPKRHTRVLSSGRVMAPR